MIDNPYEFITKTQRRFVVDRGADLDNRGWATDYTTNLHAPLHPDTLRDFEEDGEISPKGAGRIAAPHGSTSLAINMFDEWRGNDLTPLGKALEVDVDGVVGYEKSHSLRLNRPAQPDIEFTTTDGTPFAVEVKLREPYDSKRYSNGFKPAYFEKPGLWTGSPNLYAFAEGVRDGDVTHTTLHSAQLVKHALGLRRSYGQDFVLGYLWHYVPSTVGNTHMQELEEFASIASADINFTSITVTELLHGLDADQCDPTWSTYMTDRYITPLGR